MSGLLIAIHIIACFILIVAVLMQSGKSADLAGAFGGVGSQTVFGPRGAASVLHRVTTICAVLFMLTSLGMWMFSEKGAKSALVREAPEVTEKTQQTEEKKAPAAEPEQKTEQQTAETEKKD